MERYWTEWQQARMPFTSEFLAAVILIFWWCFKIHNVPHFCVNSITGLQPNAGFFSWIFYVHSLMKEIKLAFEITTHMFVSMRAYPCTYVQTHTYLCMCSCVSLCVWTCMHACTHAPLCLPVHLHISMRTCLYVHLCVLLCFVRAHLCLCVRCFLRTDN